MRGDRWTQPVILRAAFNWAGCVATAQLRAAPDDSAVVYTFVVTPTIIAPDAQGIGEMRLLLDLPAAVSRSLRPGVYCGDVEVVRSSGQPFGPYTVTRFTLEIGRDVTRP